MEDTELVSITGGPLKPHEYVLVKQEMTAGDEAWIQNHSAKSRGSSKESMEVILTIGQVQLATAQRMIKGWSLTKTTILPDGKKSQVPFPYAPENIEKLPRAIYKYILKKIDEMNPDEEESDEDFLPDAPDSSEDNFQTERAPRLKH